MTELTKLISIPVNVYLCPVLGIASTHEAVEPFLYSVSTSKGFIFVYPLQSTSLTKMTGTKYYADTSTSNQSMSINYFGLSFLIVIFETIHG